MSVRQIVLPSVVPEVMMIVQTRLIPGVAESIIRGGVEIAGSVRSPRGRPQLSV